MPPPITATRPMAAPRTVHKAATNKAQPVTTPDYKDASPALYKNAKAASANAARRASASISSRTASSPTSASNKAPAYSALTTSSWNPCAASAATTRHRTAAPSTEPSRSTSNKSFSPAISRRPDRARSRRRRCQSQQKPPKETYRQGRQPLRHVDESRL